jgi:hypothetical protein
MKVVCYLIIVVLCVICGVRPDFGSAQSLPPIGSAQSLPPIGNGWLQDASHTFLNAYQARGRFQTRPFVARQAIFEKIETYVTDSETGKQTRRAYDEYRLYLIAGSFLSEDEVVSIAFGAKAPTDRFEIDLFVQPGKKIGHRTITVAPSGAIASVAFPGDKGFLDHNADPVQAVLVPHDLDASKARILHASNHQFTLRLRIETMTDRSLQGAVYLCIDDDAKSFVEGQFTAHELDPPSRQMGVQRIRVLNSAVRADDTAQLRALLKEGSTPNTKLYRDREEARFSGVFGYDTLLTMAAVQGAIDCVKVLLDAGADIDRPNSEQSTPLMIAALSGNLKMVDCLLTRGANPNAAGPAGRTALHLAVRRTGSLEVCKRLAEAGADINATDEQGSTPLIEAIHSEQLDIARWLLDNHADVNAKDRQGHTAFYYAATDAARVMLYQAGAKP